MTLKITSDNISSTTLSTLGGAKITSLTYPSSATAANPAGSETITVTGSGFSAGATVYVDTTSCATTYVSATTLTFTSPVKSVGEYHFYVYNTDGTFAMKPGGYISSSLPTWVTSSGALTGATLNISYSISVSATGDSIVYGVTSGSLPTGLSLNASTGVITGTPTVEATSNFTITATDSQNQGVARSFSIAVVNAALVDYLVVAGGGGGGMTPPQGYGSGGGAGGLLTATSIGVLPGITYTITVAAGGTRASYGSTIPTNGGNSIISGSGFSTVTSIGGGRGSTNGTDNGGNGGSGGGGGKSAAGGKGVYPGSTYIDAPRQGYDGGNGDGTYDGGSGGGAGASGGGAGGIGLSSSITGTATYYAGGGGGGSGGAGGLGGGGSLGGPENGTANTGGGGSASTGAGPNAGSGGSGVVILRFLSSATVSATTGSPTITTDGSYKVYKYTASGSITF